MSEEKDIREDLTPCYEDYAHAGVKAGLSFIPVIGGSISEFFSMVIAPPLEKRRDEWMAILYQELVRLETVIEGFRIDTLKDNEQFISVLLYATNVAMRTHQKDKIEALRNAVLNSALNISIENNIQQIFLNLIDRYTPLHLLLLKFFKDPRGYGEKRHITYPSWSMGGPASVLEHTFPDLKNKRELYEQITRDLSNDGLLNSKDFLHVTMTANGMFDSRTSKMGINLLNYITLIEP